MIKKRGRTYWLDLRVAGKRHRCSLHTDEHQLAIERARDIAANLRRGIRSHDVPLRAIAAQYIDWAKVQKPASAREEKYRLDAMTEFFSAVGAEYLGDITPLVIERMRQAFLAGGKSRSTVNRYCALLRSLFYRAIDWEVYAGANPLRKVKFFRERPEVKALTADDVGRVMAAARQIAAAPQSPVQRLIPDIVELALMTGLRKSELLGLRWRDVRDGNAEIRGKGDKRRLVPLNADALAAVHRQPRSGEFVFDIPNRHQPDLLRRTVRQIAKLSGVPFHLHLCRHTFATRLLAAGIDIVTIAEMLGHSSTMTALLYSHSSPDRKKRAVEALETQTGGHKKRTQT